MKVVLNFVTRPYFCAFIKGEALYASHTWQESALCGYHTWHFWKKINPKTITFLGALQGPGSFSALRACSAILQTAAFLHPQKIYQTDAFTFWRYLLKRHHFPVRFVLESFGNRVFYVTEKRKSLKPLTKIPSHLPLWAESLPPEKQKIFPKAFSLPRAKPLPLELYHFLRTTTPEDHFTPYYHFPALS